MLTAIETIFFELVKRKANKKRLYFALVDKNRCHSDWIAEHCLGESYYPDVIPRVRRWRHGCHAHLH